MALKFAAPPSSCSILVKGIPDGLPLADVEKALSAFGSLEYLGLCKKFAADSYSVKVTYYSPERAAEALRAVLRGLLPWPGLGGAKAAQRPASESTLSLGKSAVLLSEAVGPFNWSMRIEALRTQPPVASKLPARPRGTNADDLGLFAVSRAQLQLHPDQLDDSRARQLCDKRHDGGGGDDAFGPPVEDVEDATSLAAAGHEGPGLQQLQQPAWVFSTLPPPVFKGIAPPSCSGETRFAGVAMLSQKPNFGPPDLSLPPPVSRAPAGHAVPQRRAASAAEVRGGAAARGGGSSGRGGAQQRAPASRADAHSCLRAKVAILVRNPDGSVTRSAGYGGCACLPPTVSSRFEAVQEALERIEHKERHAAAVAAAAAAEGHGVAPDGAAASSAAASSAAVGPSAARDAGVKRTREYGAVLRGIDRPSHRGRRVRTGLRGGVAGASIPAPSAPTTGLRGGVAAAATAAAGSAAGSACIAVSDLNLAPWNPVAVSALRSDAAQEWRELSFSAEQGAEGFHLKFALADAYREALGALELRPWAAGGAEAQAAAGARRVGL